MIRAAYIVPLVFCFFLSVAGCNPPDGGPPRYEVTGTVKLDGKPLPKGTIAFQSAEDIKEGRPPATANIQNGEYSTRMTTGKKRVKIYSYQETNELDEDGEKVIVQTVPPQFNQDSKLEANVTEAGPNRFDFDLKK